MEVTIEKTALKTVVADITGLKVDIIVNAANSSLMGGGGVDGAIHRAGGPEILEECKSIIAEIKTLPTGEAVITTAGKMPARFVIHTVGPVWHGGNRDEARLLRNCYANSLKLAMEHGGKSIAFPSISTGIYGYPVERASVIAVDEVVEFAHRNPGKFDEIIFCGYDAHTEKQYAIALKERVKK